MASNKLLSVLLMIGALQLAGGCAVQRELWYATVDPQPDPKQGQSVCVVSASDTRKFNADPKDGDAPTWLNRNDLSNPAARSRMIGRARLPGGEYYYKYPEGQTVESAVRTAVENALRTKGYVVVAPGSAGAASAIPVKVEIAKFWLTQAPSAFYAAIHFELQVTLTTSIVAGGATSVSGKGDEVIYGNFSDTLTEHCVAAGLSDLATNSLPKLNSP